MPITFVPGFASLSFDKHANEAAYQTKRALLKPLFGKLHNMPLRIQRSETFGRDDERTGTHYSSFFCRRVLRNWSIQFSAHSAEGARLPDAAISLIIPATTDTERIYV